MSINKQITRFSFAGVSAVGVDLLSYYLLIDYMSYDLAKTISFILGAVVAYLLNKFWTFEKYDFSYQEIIMFATLYMISLGANVLVNKLMLQLTNNMVLIAFLCATATSASMNFIGQKWWVFKR
tara:strand:- start:65 stop:436 length:372 start_codon:yes stop_codon:yes gene_type:complete